MKLNDTQEKIKDIYQAMATLQLEKNKKYGNAALEPLGIFAKGNNKNNEVCVRLDDKLSRVKNSEELRMNDCADIIGYLILLFIEQGWEGKDILALID